MLEAGIGSGEKKIMDFVCFSRFVFFPVCVRYLLGQTTGCFILGGFSKGGRMGREKKCLGFLNVVWNQI